MCFSFLSDILHEGGLDLAPRREGLVLQKFHEKE